MMKWLAFLIVLETLSLASCHLVLDGLRLDDKGGLVVGQIAIPVIWLLYLITIAYHAATSGGEEGTFRIPGLRTSEGADGLTAWANNWRVLLFFSLLVKIFLKCNLVCLQNSWSGPSPGSGSGFTTPSPPALICNVFPQRVFDQLPLKGIVTRIFRLPPMPLLLNSVLFLLTAPVNWALIHMTRTAGTNTNTNTKTVDKNVYT